MVNFVSPTAMNWVTVIWTTISAASLTLAAVHLLVWWWRRAAWVNLLFAVTAMATTLFAAGELWMMHAATPEEFAMAVRWTHLPVWGTEQTYNHMSAGWAWAFDAPFSWFKQNASKLGGIRQCMAVSWPGHIKVQGALREQFCHVIDYCADHSRSGRHQSAGNRGRHQAGAD